MTTSTNGMTGTSKTALATARTRFLSCFCWFLGILVSWSHPMRPPDQSGRGASERRITEPAAGFGAALNRNDWFGLSVAGLGDLTGDGVADLAVGARGDDDGAPTRVRFGSS